MYWDTHLHCHFSSDSTASPEDMILAAISRRLDGICFTDHMDYDYPEKNKFVFDLDKYFQELDFYRKKYQNSILVRIGVEIGLQPHLKQPYSALTTTCNFDQVIGSSHVVHGKDPYNPGFFDDKREEEAYREYFESILKNLAIFDDFDVYGHLDYVVRYGPTKNQNYSYEKYKDVIDEILRTLIAKGKGIELNTAGFRHGLGQPNPGLSVLKRYRELGGEILTLGSDAHKPEDIAYDFHCLKGILQETGFFYYTIFEKRKPIFYSV